jgi:hypothetical protein
MTVRGWSSPFGAKEIYHHVKLKSWTKGADVIFGAVSYQSGASELLGAVKLQASHGNAGMLCWARRFT